MFELQFRIAARIKIFGHPFVPRLDQFFGGVWLVICDEFCKHLPQTEAEEHVRLVRVEIYVIRCWVALFQSRTWKAN